MATTIMDVEMESPSKQEDNTACSSDQVQSDEPKIKIHPLAIICMSDHHTRIRMGGTPLPSDSPVVGILFGEDGQVVDGIDIERASDEGELGQNIRTKIDLHLTVYPLRRVVGWYRVTDGDDNDAPTPEDLKISKTIMAQFCVPHPPIFVRMNANACSTDTDASTNESKTTSASESQDLPISIYETVTADNDGTVFVEVQFELETTEPERIAVETVYRSRPATTGDDESILERNAQNLYSSIQSLVARVTVLRGHLTKMQQSPDIVPLDRGLLRKVECLLSQLPVVVSDDVDLGFDRSQATAYLAVIAKATRAIGIYAEKFRAVNENNNLNRDILSLKGY